MLLGMVTALIAGVICAYAMPLARATGLMDKPDGLRKRHGKETPLVGGIAVFAAGGFAVIPMALGGEVPVALAAVVIAGLLAVILGALDDRFDLPALPRLIVLAGIVGVTMAVVPELRPDRVVLAIGIDVAVPAALLVGFFVLVVCGFVNAVNMTDGVNGAMGGLILFWAGALAVIGPDELSGVIYPFVGAIAIVLAFNLRNRLFFGDAGSYGLGTLVALLAVYSYTSYSGLFPVETYIALFLLPVLDCLRLIVKRKRLGRPAFSADRNHLHHLLWDAMPARYALVAYWAMGSVPGALAVLIPDAGLVIILLSVIGYFGLTKMLEPLPATTTPATTGTTTAGKRSAAK